MVSKYNKQSVNIVDQAKNLTEAITMEYRLSVYDPMDGWLWDKLFDELENAEREAAYLFEKFGYECHIEEE